MFAQLVGAHGNGRHVSVEGGLNHPKLRCIELQRIYGANAAATGKAIRGTRSACATSCLRIFPVPPLQPLRIVLRLRSKVHGAPEYIKNAPIHMVAHFTAEFSVKELGVPAS
jgi:hypothetical protein